jgi:hypothetical protein
MSFMAEVEMPPERANGIAIQLRVRGRDAVFDDPLSRDLIVLLPIDRPVKCFIGKFPKTRQQSPGSVITGCDNALSALIGPQPM